jgi:hypothetical protein
MIRFVVTVASLVAVIAPSTPAGAGACAVMDPSAMPVTLKDAVIEDGGGVIVGIGYTGEKSSGGSEVVTQPGWRFRDGGKLVAPTIDKIAPGLAVYRLPASKTQTYVLENDKHIAIVAVRRSKDRDAAVLPAPMPTGAEHATFVSPRDRSESVTLHLIAPAPRGALALVVYGPDGAPRSFGPVADNAKDVVVYRSRGRCELAVPGEVATHAGERITVAWLDASGRLSATSRAIEITEGAIKQ